jgi:hypothetical protein
MKPSARIEMGADPPSREDGLETRVYRNGGRPGTVPSATVLTTISTRFPPAVSPRLLGAARTGCRSNPRSLGRSRPSTSRPTSYRPGRAVACPRGPHPESANRPAGRRSTVLGLSVIIPAAARGGVLRHVPGMWREASTRGVACRTAALNAMRWRRRHQGPRPAADRLRTGAARWSPRRSCRRSASGSPGERPRLHPRHAGALPAVRVAGSGPTGDRAAPAHPRTALIAKQAGGDQVVLVEKGSCGPRLGLEVSDRRSRCWP